MGYATATKVRQRLQALPAAEVDAVFDQIIAGALEDADGLVDAYISTRFPVPITTPPAMLVSIASDIAAAYVVRDSFSGGGESESPGLYKTLYEPAIALLEKIANGDIGLPLPSTDPEIPSGANFGGHSGTNTPIIENSRVLRNSMLDGWVRQHPTDLLAFDNEYGC